MYLVTLQREDFKTTPGSYWKHNPANEFLIIDSIGD